MTLKVAINGFGRIGRRALFNALGRTDIDFVGINDLTDPDTLAYLFKNDSIFGRFQGEVAVDGQDLIVNGDRIRITAEKDPAKLPWKEMGVDIVLECTGFFTKRDGASKHLEAGARAVLVSAPGKGMDLTVVLGVNDHLIDTAKHQIISNASCTTNCLAPVAKVLDDAFGIQHGLMTTVHAYTSTQALLDMPIAKDRRRGRAAALSMIPTSTGAASAVGEVLPHLKGKLDGLSVRVPTPNVSLTDVVVNVARETSVEEVNAALVAAANGPLKGILGISEPDLVSIDFVGSTYSSVVDTDLTRVMNGNMIKVMAWYDNENGYATRMVDLAVLVGSKL